MRTVGLITEYNPFHNGHLHHLRESLRITGADASVAVMSGHFLQRGEPALVDKWLRSEMALAAGVDLVLELPVPFACNSAPHFAMGAVQTLNALGVVDALCFGSETGDLALLDEIACLLYEKAGEIEAMTAVRLREGVNYPTARAEVLAQCRPGLAGKNISTPNNILGIEYLLALRKTGRKIKAETIVRRGAGYHETEAVGEIASATGIRKKLADGDDVMPLMPEMCWRLLNDAMQQGRCLDFDKLFVALQSCLLLGPQALEGLYLVDDGLDRRLAEVALTVNSYDELVEMVNSRHWTLTRIQRVLSYVLLQLPGAQMSRFLENGPLYIRLLGATEKGRAVLAKARAGKSLPVIDDPARARTVIAKFYRGQPEKKVLAEQMLACDLRATRLYGLLQRSTHPGNRNQDFYQPVRQA